MTRRLRQAAAARSGGRTRFDVVEAEGQGLDGLAGRHGLRRRFQAVLHEQRLVVALVEDLDLHVGIELAQAAHLPVLLGDQLLVERGDLDEQVVGREVEVGTEGLDGIALAVALENERTGLVLPRDAVEVEELGELALGVVREARVLVRLRADVLGSGQDQPLPLTA